MKNVGNVIDSIAGKETARLRNFFLPALNWLKPRWKTLVFLFFQVVAILLVILGWYLDHGNQNKWIMKVFAPRYAPALDLVDSMFTSLGFEIDSSTPGFSEITFILSEQLEGQLPDLGDIGIARIKVVGTTALAINPDPRLSGPRLALTITLEDGRELPGVEVQGSFLQSQIEHRFLEALLFRWGERLQWLGIIIAFLTFFVDKLSELRQCNIAAQ